MTEKLATILEKNMPKMSRPITLTLPKLSGEAKAIDIDFLEEIK
jgi:hypothetical protein